MGDASRPSYPAASKYQGDVAHGYVRRRATDPTWTWEDQQVRQLTKELPPGTRVLDVPFGTGRYVPAYLGAGWHVLGSDISHDMILAAAAELGATVRSCAVVVAPAEAMPFADASIDLVVCSRFLQWVPEVEAIRRIAVEMARVGRRELFVQIRIPAGRAAAPTLRGALRDGGRAVKRRLRRRSNAHRASITAHPEPDLIAVLESSGWELRAIGPECPADPGLRFYRFSRAEGG